MSELSTDLTPAEGVDTSTQLDEGAATTQGTPAKEPDRKPEARLDTIKRAAQDVGVKDEESEPAKEPAKEPVKEPETEPSEVKAEEPKPKAEERPRRQTIEAPDKFLPRAKELWQNVPHEVRSEMQRVMAETESEATQARESVKEYEAVRPFAELAKRSGTTLDQALGRYVQMEQTLRSDPVSGFRALGQNMGMNPVQMIGHILAAHNIRPEQLAQHIAVDPNQYTALAQPQKVQQPTENNDVQQLKQQIEILKQNMQQSQIHATVIEPFARENPRYYELEGTIAHFLNSDIVPKSLSPNDRLAAAYDMAVRISPATKSDPAPEDEEEKEPDSRAGKDFGGTKSVRGAPASGVDTTNRRKSKMSRRDSIDAAMADLGLAH